MATEIVGSLFGVTPEMFQQRQAEMADRQALEYAQLSPLQRASFNLARGGYQLAGALGGQDPQLQMISRRQAIARQIDPTNLNSMQMGIQALAQAGDQVGAMQLSQVLRQAENDIALRSQREASALASTAQAGKTQQEVDSLKRQQEAYRRFKAGETGEALAPAAATTAQAQAVEPSVADNLANLQQIPPKGTKDIFAGQLSKEDKQRIEEDRGLKDLYETYSTNAAFFLNTSPDDYYYRNNSYILAEQAKKLSDLAGIKVPGTVEGLRQILNIREPAAPAAAPVTTAMVAPTAAAPVAQAAQPAAAAPVSQAPSDIAAQIKVLEDRRRQLNTLFPDVTAAKNESEDLKEQIKVLRDQMKPADVGQDREAISLQEFNKRYSQLTTAERETVNKKIADAKTQSFGADRESIALEVYDKPFLQLTTAQRAVVNKRVEEEQNRRARSGAATYTNQAVPQKDWIKFEEYLQGQPTFKQTAAMISAAPGVLRVIRESTSNDFASKALPTSIAKLFDQGTLSNQDVSRYARTGGLDDRLAALASEFFTGRVTSVTKEQAERFMSAVYRGALLDQRDIYVEQADRFEYTDSTTFKKTLKQLDDKLAKFREVQPAPAPGAAAAPGAGTAPGAGGRIMSRQEEDALLRRYGQNPGQNTR